MTQKSPQTLDDWIEEVLRLAENPDVNHMNPPGWREQALRTIHHNLKMARKIELNSRIIMPPGYRLIRDTEFTESEQRSWASTNYG